MELPKIWVSVNQISIIFLIVTSQSQSPILNLFLELGHLLGAVEHLGQLVAGEQVVGKPVEGFGWKMHFWEKCCKIREYHLLNRWWRNLRMTFSSTFAISSSFSSAFVRASRGSLKLSISSPSSLIRSRIFSSSLSSSSESEHKPHLQVGVVRSRCQMPIGHKLY